MNYTVNPLTRVKTNLLKRFTNLTVVRFIWFTDNEFNGSEIAPLHDSSTLRKGKGSINAIPNEY